MRSGAEEQEGEARGEDHRGSDLFRTAPQPAKRDAWFRRFGFPRRKKRPRPFRPG